VAVITSLVGYWALDEASGNAVDSHGSNTLTETSGTIAATTGKVSGCRDFEAGDTEYFTIADNTALSMGDIDFSIQAWVNAESLAVSMAILGKDLVTPSREYVMNYDNGTTQFSFFVSPSGTSAVVVQASNFGTPSTATWYHLIAWHDSVNNQIGIAVNAGTPNTTSHTTGVQDSNGPFQIGARNAGANWDGLIDEVAIWKKVLTSDERTWLYNSGNGRSYTDIVAESGSVGRLVNRGLLRGGLVGGRLVA
jgi:hypothetical protein